MTIVFVDDYETPDDWDTPATDADADNHQPSRLLPDRALTGTRSSHRWSKMPGGWDRLNTMALFPSGNEWGIPDLPAATFVPSVLVAYSSRSEVARAKPDAAVHFFLDDYRFEIVWAKPQRGLTRIQSVGAALTPDFSLWRGMPLAMQLWQVYRSRWCGAWLLHQGVRVIPTVSWSTEESYPFAFAGIEPGSVVAVSTVGVRDARAKGLFAAGYAEMVRHIGPSMVLVYGRAASMQQTNLSEYRIYPTRWN